jgi:hypothetical protein
MTAVASTGATIETLGDLLNRLGGVSPNRIRFRPSPGFVIPLRTIFAELDRHGD